MFANSFSMKFVLVTTIFLIVITTITLCVTKPKLHKPFQLSVIEYFLKINSDGTSTTTKQTTTTILKDK